MSVLSADGQKILIQQLFQDEGYKKFPYKDTLGFTTIGIGRNLDAQGISLDEAYYLLTNDVIKVEENLYKIFPFMQHLSDNRKMVLINMGFNIGMERLSRFVGMIHALSKGDYERAALEMSESVWAKQVGARATRLVQMMKDG